MSTPRLLIPSLALALTTACAAGGIGAAMVLETE